jgi:mono/diheme cytochrome c family protein
VTEIPEHLLARSRARREAIGQSEGEAPEAAPAAAAAVERASDAAPAAAAGPAGVATTTPAKAPAAPPAPPEKPKRPEVIAAETRRKIPWWAVPALAGLPFWAILYAGTLNPRDGGALTPALEEGEVLYTSNPVAACSGCHGVEGGGGIGPAFSGGAIGETFANYEDHIQWVALGSSGWQSEVGPTYGDSNKPVNGGMPNFGEGLTEEEIALVVRYEREVLGELPCEPDLAVATGEECAE